MSFDFPTEIVEEGRVKVVVPKLEAYVEEVWEYAPSKAPVFYNPAMELNRDLAVLAIQAYQRIVGRRLSVCEPLTGCGVRGVRFAVEVEGIRKIVLGDINPVAVQLAKLNVERHNLAGRTVVVKEDANLLMSQNAAPRKRFDCIDVDPFGSPAPYLDSAFRALRHGGLLALTATDLAPLCGVHPQACLRKYGGKPLRTEYCHELALRLLLGSLATTAAKHGVGVKPLFGHSTDHYIRVYTRVNHGARRADCSLREMGYVLHCFACLHRETLKGLVPRLGRKCPECGSKMSVAGPLWLGRLVDGDFCASMEESAGRGLRREGRIVRLLSLIRGEAEGPPTYYVTDKVSERLNLPTPPLSRVIEEFKGDSFQALPTHFNPKGFRTDAPAKVVAETIKALGTHKG